MTNSPKATCRATSNIAFVKYWGRIDHQLRLPMNGSISMNLAAAYTTTTVEFDPNLDNDQIDVASTPLNQKQAARVFQQVDRIREIASVDTRVRVASQNNFPMGAGIASSASAFAALTVAAAHAAGLSLDEKQLTILARQGSGSACRSVPSGFVEWHYGEVSDDSFAETIAPTDHWDIRDLIAITQTEHKAVGSSKGIELVTTSPFNDRRVELAHQSMDIIRQAILDHNWTQFGEETEREAVRLHMIAMTSNPPIFYWSPVTMRLIKSVIEWRNDGLEIYFTIDAGANVHIMARGQDADKIQGKLANLEGVEQVIHSKVGHGAQLVETHLF